MVSNSKKEQRTQRRIYEVHNFLSLVVLCVHCVSLILIETFLVTKATKEQSTQRRINEVYNLVFLVVLCALRVPFLSVQGFFGHKGHKENTRRPQRDLTKSFRFARGLAI